MAEETTSAIASPAPSTEQAPATSNPPQQPAEQASTPDKPAQQKVNLFEIPEFKQFQKQQNQTISQLQQQLRETERQYQQRLAQLETRDMDDGERDAYLTRQQLQQLQQERDNYAAYVQQMQADMRKQQILNRISAKTGVPVNELVEFSDADDAWEYANEKALEREKKQLAAQQREARSSAAAAVDLGGGTPITEPNPFDVARQQKNTVAFTKEFLARRRQTPRE